MEFFEPSKNSQKQKQLPHPLTFSAIPPDPNHVCEIGDRFRLFIPTPRRDFMLIRSESDDIRLIKSQSLLPEELEEEPPPQDTPIFTIIEEIGIVQLCQRILSIPEDDDCVSNKEVNIVLSSFLLVITQVIFKLQQPEIVSKLNEIIFKDSIEWSSQNNIRTTKLPTEKQKMISHLLQSVSQETGLLTAIVDLGLTNNINIEKIQYLCFLRSLRHNIFPDEYKSMEELQSKYILIFQQQHNLYFENHKLCLFSTFHYTNYVHLACGLMVNNAFDLKQEDIIDMCKILSYKSYEEMSKIEEMRQTAQTIFLVESEKWLTKKSPTATMSACTSSVRGSDTIVEDLLRTGNLHDPAGSNRQRFSFRGSNFKLKNVEKADSDKSVATTVSTVSSVPSRKLTRQETSLGGVGGSNRKTVGPFKDSGASIIKHGSSGSVTTYDDSQSQYSPASSSRLIQYDSEFTLDGSNLDEDEDVFVEDEDQVEVEDDEGDYVEPGSRRPSFFRDINPNQKRVKRSGSTNIQYYDNDNNSDSSQDQSELQHRKQLQLPLSKSPANMFTSITVGIQSLGLDDNRLIATPATTTITAATPVTDRINVEKITSASGLHRSGKNDKTSSTSTSMGTSISTSTARETALQMSFLELKVASAKKLEEDSDDDSEDGNNGNGDGDGDSAK